MKDEIDYKIPDEPKTYEEALKTLKESPYDVLHQKAYKSIKLRAVIIAGLGVAVCVVYGLATSDFRSTPYFIFATAVMSGIFLLPILDLKSNKKKIESGKGIRGSLRRRNN